MLSKTKAGSTRRAFSWLLLLALLAGVLTFPAEVRPDLSPIPTLSIFHSLTEFGLLFCAWAFVLFAMLLATHEKSKGDFESLLLSVLFSIGFVGFWVLVPGGQPGGDSAVNAAILREIGDRGKLGDIRHPNVNLTYLEFPGLFLVAAVLREILSLDVIAAVKLTTLIEIGLLATLYYVVAWTYLRNQQWAALAAIWAVEGNRQSGFWPSFFPGNFGVLYLMMVVLVLLRTGSRSVVGIRELLLLVLILMGACLAHPVVPIVLLGMLGVVFFTRRDKAPGFVRATTLFLALVLPLTWLFFSGAARIVNSIILRAYATLVNPGDLLRYFRIIARANLGQVTPPWVTSINLFWALTTVGIGGLIALWRLSRMHSQPDGDRIIVATLVGITGASLLFTFLTGGQEALYRVFLYGPLFTVLLACSAIILQGHDIRRLLQGGVALTLLALVLPTFLLSNRGIVFLRSFPSENRTGEFISSLYPRGENLRVFTHISTAVNLVYYLPAANYMTEPEIARQSNPKAWRDGLARVLKGFVKEPGQQEASLYVRYDGRVLMYYGNYFGAKNVEDRYGILMSELEATSNKVFSSGETAIYAPTWRGP